MVIGMLAVAVLSSLTSTVPQRRTTISNRGEAFYINGKPTYRGITWNGKKIEGLLFNSRMVQGIFDDLNPETRHLWSYPDTGKWDPERNTREFISAMPDWRKHGLLAFTLNLQGGNPQGYSSGQPWHNSAIAEDGSLRHDYMQRLERILDRADQLGMAVILGVFYFGQDERLKDERAVLRALNETVDWLVTRGYRNVMLEINNECNVDYQHPILQSHRVHELIEYARIRSQAGALVPDQVIRGEWKLLIGTSYGGGSIPRENVVRSSDFLLLHGNGVGSPQRIAEMVRKTRAVPGYRPMPILFNEDDHFDFDKPANNMAAAISEYASWGHFDFRMRREGYEQGYQSVPVDWRICSPRKRAFFEKVREMTTGKAVGLRDAPSSPHTSLDWDDVSASQPATDRSHDTYPGVEWQTITPEEAGVDRGKLDALRDLVGGRGCVVKSGRMVYSWGEIGRSGDVASACKPVISSLLLLAVQERSIRNVDARVSEVELRLKDLNGGKDAGITWRHLASQTSGYGLAEAPGKAWAYNDFALALFYDALTGKVFRTSGTELIQSRFAIPLGFQDECRFDALGEGRPGRLAISVRDFARFGLLWLHRGKWRDRQLVRPSHVKQSLSSMVPRNTPRTTSLSADMLPGQRSIGGGKNQTPTGPGFYTFNWWVNAKDKEGRRLFAALPPDAFAAMGHGAKRALIVVPSWDIIVSWNDANIDDMDASPADPNTRCNQAMRLIRELVMPPPE